MAAEQRPLSERSGRHHGHQLSWWLAAGLVGADIGTSVFYSTGVLYPLVGFTAPFFITLVCLAMWLFKTAYQEGCAVNPLNGGAYSMVLQTVGRRAALVVGSLTILSYLATAVVSALSGAHYLSTLWTAPWPTWLIVAVAAVPVVLFAGLNLLGLKESTVLVFGIAAFHFVALIVMDVYGLLLALTQGAHWDRLTSGFAGLELHAVTMAFAAAFLGITGFESAAQIIEEIREPTWKAIRKIYLTIVLLVSFTGPLSSLLCIVLLSDADIARYKSAFLSGLAVYEGGTPMLYLLVANACLTLFAAVNTAFAGATGLMTTMGKQGNLPVLVLRQWGDRLPQLKGFPFVALPFGALCLLMMAVFPGNVDRLGEVYGMAFLSVMISYCAGVVLLRLHQPTKVSRAPWTSHWTFNWRGTPLPIAAVAGCLVLVLADGILIATAHHARDLGLHLFMAVLLVMALYRLGQVESRMVRLPDLRLGIGKYRGVDKLPELPTYVICTASIVPTSLVSTISYLLKRHGEDIELLLFHAEEQQAPHGVVSEGLERLISQQLEDFYAERNFVLGVKVLPGNLIEVLTEYGKTRPFTRIYISTGHDPESSEELRAHLATEMSTEVERLDERTLPKGPGVWYTQWSQGQRQSRAWGTRGNTGPLPHEF
ncbi:MAG: APC family permease [Candidatus Sericytochromatia bacterium]|nr:APC family permease [Candidatus Sericytochromatia bacterium]